jgi:hypothetical protein
MYYLTAEMFDEINFKGLLDSLKLKLLIHLCKYNFILTISMVLCRYYRMKI